MGSAEVCDSRNWNSRSNSFVRAPPSGGGSNAPRPAVSVPHIDVNADGCRARQARSCKNTSCRGGISEILVESQCLQRLDDLQNYHFQTVLDNVWNFAVANTTYHCVVTDCAPGVQLHVRARFSQLHVSSVLPLPTSRAYLEPPKGLGWG